MLKSKRRVIVKEFRFFRTSTLIIGCTIFILVTVVVAIVAKDMQYKKLFSIATAKENVTSEKFDVFGKALNVYYAKGNEYTAILRLCSSVNDKKVEEAKLAFYQAKDDLALAIKNYNVALGEEKIAHKKIQEAVEK